MQEWQSDVDNASGVICVWMYTADFGMNMRRLSILQMLN